MQRHRRITKSSQARKIRRAERLRELLSCSPVDSLLLDACARKNASDVEALLRSHPQINPDTVRDSRLRTPLHIACGRKDNRQEAADIAGVLIRAGSDVNNGVGDVDGLQPLHMAVLAGNIQCILLLLEEGASVPASDPFRLTPLLLAKLKLENIQKTRLTMRRDNEADTRWSQRARMEYEDLKQITEVLANHLANKHIALHDPYSISSVSRPYHGLSASLFARSPTESDPLDQAIKSITEQLSEIGMHEKRTTQQSEDQFLKDALGILLDKVRKLGIEE